MKKYKIVLVKITQDFNLVLFVLSPFCMPDNCFVVPKGATEKKMKSKVENMCFTKSFPLKFPKFLIFFV